MPQCKVLYAPLSIFNITAHQFEKKEKKGKVQYFNIGITLGDLRPRNDNKWLGY